jgi:hypothetical protein
LSCRKERNVGTLVPKKIIKACGQRFQAKEKPYWPISLPPIFNYHTFVIIAISTEKKSKITALSNPRQMHCDFVKDMSGHFAASGVFYKISDGMKRVLYANNEGLLDKAFDKTRRCVKMKKHDANDRRFMLQAE